MMSDRPTLIESLELMFKTAVGLFSPTPALSIEMQMMLVRCKTVPRWCGDAKLSPAILLKTECRTATHSMSVGVGSYWQLFHSCSKSSDDMYGRDAMLHPFTSFEGAKSGWLVAAES